MSKVVHLQRFASACAILSGVLFAAPASAQSVDVSVILESPGLLLYGESAITANITNAGPSHAHNVVLTVTLPSGVKAGTTSCTTTAATPGVYTCPITSDLTDGQTVSFDFPISVTPPDPLPTDPAQCPAATGQAVGTFSVTVSSDSPDTNAGNDSATTGIALGPYADLALTITGPANTGEGQMVAYDYTVTNNGPCPADAVLFTESTTGLLTLQSVTGACTGFVDGECDLGTLAVGQTVAFAATYQVGSYGSEVQTTAVTGGGSVEADTGDPKTGNNETSAMSKLDLDSGGCSTGGAAGLLALIPLLALRLMRRRSA